VTPADADLSPYVGGAGEQIPQEGDDLGERMRRCFERLHESGAARVVMIGADVPHIGEDVIAAAFAALQDRDAVLVPTRDGGYCLIALRAPHDIFSDVPMGTGAVFARTCARLAALGLRWRALGESFDVDTLEDVGALHELIARGEVALPHTASVLRTWQAAGWLR
jgi:glycosyltransferase A (GT-A) superfamily protein (DUF2064 family)